MRAIQSRTLDHPKPKFDLFAPEVGWDFAPFLGFPFDDGIAIVMGLEPVFSTSDNLEKGLCLGIALQGRLTLTLLNPENGVVRIGVDGFIVQTLIPAKGQSMDDGEELTYIVCTMNRTIVEHTITRLQIDGLILHWTRISTTSRIHSPSVSPYFQR